MITSQMTQWTPLKGYRHEHIVFVDSGYFDIPNGLARSPLRFPDQISQV